MKTLMFTLVMLTTLSAPSVFACGEGTDATVKRLDESSSGGPVSGDADSAAGSTREGAPAPAPTPK